MVTRHQKDIPEGYEIVRDNICHNHWWYVATNDKKFVESKKKSQFYDKLSICFFGVIFVFLACLGAVSTYASAHTWNILTITLTCVCGVAFVTSIIVCGIFITKCTRHTKICVAYEDTDAYKKDLEEIDRLEKNEIKDKNDKRAKDLIKTYDTLSSNKSEKEKIEIISDIISGINK